MYSRAFVLCVVLYSQLSYGQTNKTNDVEVSLNYGPVLGSQGAIGLTEVVNTWSMKINMGVSEFRPEFFVHRGSSNENPNNNINLLLMGLTAKNVVKIEELDYFRPLILTGIQYVKYDSSNAGERLGNGFHIGFGVEMDITKNLQFRNDFIFCNGPGRILIVTLGLQIHLGGASSNSSETESP